MSLEGERYYRRNRCHGYYLSASFFPHEGEDFADEAKSAEVTSLELAFRILHRYVFYASGYAVSGVAHEDVYLTFFTYDGGDSLLHGAFVIDVGFRRYDKRVLRSRSPSGKGVYSESFLCQHH